MTPKEIGRWIVSLLIVFLICIVIVGFSVYGWVLWVMWVISGLAMLIVATVIVHDTIWPNDFGKEENA